MRHMHLALAGHRLFVVTVKYANVSCLHTHYQALQHIQEPATVLDVLYGLLVSVPA